MKINPSMLALSAANPGLLALAFEPDDDLYPSLSASRALGYGGRVSHSHQHSGRVDVTHDLADGVGTELRGLPVNRERCVAAYASALQTIERVMVEREPDMVQQEADIEAERIEEERKSIEREEEWKRRPMKAYEDRELERRLMSAEKMKISEKIRELRGDGRTFFGMGPFIRADEIQKLQAEYDAIRMPDSLPKPTESELRRASFIGYTGMRIYDPWDYIETKRQKLAFKKSKLTSKHMVASVASGDELLLSAEDALEIAQIEFGVFAAGLEEMFTPRKEL